MNSVKYYKFLFLNKSYASGKPFEYKIDELMKYENFNDNPNDNFGGFFISSEDVILRSIVRGNTLYEAILPNDTKIIEVPSKLIPHGRYKVDKIILTNPIQMTDEIALNLLNKTKVNEEVYFDILVGVSIYGYINTAKIIIKEHINISNIQIAIDKVNSYLDMGDGFGYGYVGVNKESMLQVLDILEEIKRK